MSERLAALRSKLPDKVLARIMLFDSHPLADLVKAIEFEPVPVGEITSAGLLLRLETAHFVPVFREFKRRLHHNNTRHLHGGPWLPLLTRYRYWRMIFDRWQYETLPELDYLPDWVKQEYLLQHGGVRVKNLTLVWDQSEKIHAAWGSRVRKITLLGV